MKRSFSKQLWMSIGILVASTIIAIVVLWYFTGEINKRAAAILQARANIVLANSSLGMVAALKEQEPQVQKYETAIGKILPPEDALINFPQAVDAVARSYSLLDDKVTFSGSPMPATTNAPGTALFSLSADGTSENIAGFLHDLETKDAQFLVHITSWNFTGSDQAVRLSAQGIVYFK